MARSASSIYVPVVRAGARTYCLTTGPTVVATIAAAVGGEVTVHATIKLRAGVLAIADVNDGGRTIEVAAFHAHNLHDYELMSANRFESVDSRPRKGL